MINNIIIEEIHQLSAVNVKAYTHSEIAAEYEDTSEPDRP